MPPSGYSPPQSSSLRAFLHSCSRALAKECEEKGEPLAVGLERELRDIRRYSGAERLTDAQMSVLQLTAAFYRSVLAGMNAGETFDSSVSSVLREFENQILAIHIEPELQTLS